MAATLHIGLLGDFHLTYGEEPVTTVHTERLQALLAYLALHSGKAQARRHVAFSFWPDSTEEQAFNNLRNLLYRLRRALPEADRFLEIDAKLLCWRAEAPFTLDVADFERLLSQAREAIQRGDSAAAQSALERAARLYRGELLSGLYDDWIFSERERLHQQNVRALEKLIRLLETGRDYGAALRHAQRLLQLDPLREPTYRLLMRLHALNQDRAGAVRVYEQCIEVLRRELDLEPEPATHELYERILNAQEVESPQLEPQEAGAGDIPFVGRQEEWKRLRKAWQVAESGAAHLVTVIGEAGIGKTRLAEELLSWVRRQGNAVAQTRSYAAEGRLAYAPVADLLRTDALRPHLSELDAVWLAEVARLLPELQAAHPELPDPESLQEGWQRQRLFEALARAVLAGGRPLMLLLDDLQWCDRDTLEWLRFLLRVGAEMPLLLLGTVRTEEVGPLHPLQELLLDLGRTGQVTEIPLGPLDEEETAQLAYAVTGTELSEAQAARLYRETEGNPLFVVESVRAGLPEERPSAEAVPDSGTLRPEERMQALSPTVRAVVTKRLAQLSPGARDLAGLAAALGRSFTFEVLAEAARMEEEPLLEGLDELWRRRIIREYGAAAYDFTHDKLREGAYAALSPVRRRLLHLRIAKALEAAHAPALDAVSAQLAAHYDRAGKAKEAMAFYQRAARAAQQIGSSGEAARLLSRALALLAELPETPERDEQELELLVAQGIALRIARGHGAPEVGRVFERAHVLCERTGEASQLFAVQRSLWAFHLIRAEYGTAQAAGEQLLALADRLDDEALCLEAHAALGLTHCWRGALIEARDHLERSVALYDPEAHRAHALRYGQDPGVASRSILAFVQWLLGYPEQAKRSIEEALKLAREVDHPFSRAYALQHAALVSLGRRDVTAMRDRAEALVELSEERGFAYWLGPGRILQGWALAGQEQPARGLDFLQKGLQEHRARGARFQSTLWLGLLAEACGRSDEVEEGLGHAETALAQAKETEERIWEAELYRVRGELLVEQAALDKAEADFHRALEVARKQQARSLELRAAISLARLWHGQDPSIDARRLLEKAFSSFAKGFDTPDLEEAHALLQAWA